MLPEQERTYSAYDLLQPPPPCIPNRNRQLELGRCGIWKRQLNQLLSHHSAIDYKGGVIICHYFCLCARLASIDEDGRFSKGLCACVCVCAWERMSGSGYDEKKKDKENRAANEEREH